MIPGLLLFVLASALYRALALRAVGRHCQTHEPPSAPGPPEGERVLIRPLCGAPAALASTLQALLEAARATRSTVLLGAEDPDDPALATAREVVARYPDVPVEIRAGRGPEGLNRKIANLVQLMDGREPEFAVLTDADVAFPPERIAGVFGRFKDDAVGAVTCPYRNVPGPGLASRIEAALANTHYLPNICLALDYEGLRFGLGAVLAVRGRALAESGGLAPLLDEPADDYVLARRIVASGHRLAWHPGIVLHHLDAKGARFALQRQLRWQRGARHSRPLGYLGLLLDQGAVGAAALGVALGAPLGVLAPLGWWALQLGLLLPRRELLGLGWRELALVPVTDALAFAVFVGAWFGRALPSGHGADASRRRRPVRGPARSARPGS